MPPPFKVQLASYDPLWVSIAAGESQRLETALGDHLLGVHHIGSTSIPGIRAKPVIDLMPVVKCLNQLDQGQRCIEALGYGWWGEYGLPERRYCIKDDPRTGRRLFQLHCYQDGSSEIGRHLAFRDYLRSRPALAREYEAEKLRCQALHPNSSHAYDDCKNAWIRRVEREALEFFG